MAGIAEQCSHCPRNDELTFHSDSHAVWGCGAAAPVAPRCPDTRSGSLTRLERAGATSQLASTRAYLDSQVGILSHSGTVLPKIYKCSERGGP